MFFVNLSDLVFLWQYFFCHEITKTLNPPKIITIGKYIVP